jgi:IMP dehydrogenase
MRKKIVSNGLTFDDVLLIPAESNVLPNQVNIESNLTANIRLHVPILSAAMDTVTETEMAIALAREGGLGILHKNMSIEEQCTEVDKVKRSESGMIVNPVTLPPDKTIEDALHVMEKYSISGIPVVENGQLVGILTNRDIRFETNHSLLIRDRMTSKNLITTPVGTTLKKAEELLQIHKIEKLLVVDDNAQLKGLITVKDILKNERYPRAVKDSFGRLRVGAAIGVSGDYLERAMGLAEQNVDILIIDTAHGHNSGVLNTVREIKKRISNIDIIAGNVATAAATQALIDAGADAVKVGIGPGAICTTRIVAGVGVPQLTAVMNCAEIAAKTGIPIIADGGIRYSGDVAKALAAGANTVMLGSMMAGLDESPGEKVLYDGRVFKSYRGMGSLAAMKKGSKDRYFQSTQDEKKMVPEGIEGIVPYKGSLNSTIHQLVGGIRASMGYCGAKDIETFQKKSEFIQVTSASIKESHPHNIKISKEAPNYRKSVD